MDLVFFFYFCLKLQRGKGRYQSPTRNLHACLLLWCGQYFFEVRCSGLYLFRVTLVWQRPSPTPRKLSKLLVATALSAWLWKWVYSRNEFRIDKKCLWGRSSDAYKLHQWVINWLAFDEDYGGTWNLQLAAASWKRGASSWTGWLQSIYLGPSILWLNCAQIYAERPFRK